MRPKNRILLGLRVLLSLALPVAGLWYAGTVQAMAPLAPGMRLPSLHPCGGESGGKEPGPVRHGSVVVAFSLTCPFCREELRRCDSLARLFGNDLAFRAVAASDGPLDGLRSSLSDRVVLERADGQAVRDSWRVEQVPTVFLLDSAGTIVSRWSGLLPADEEGLLVRALARRPAGGQ